MDDKRKDGNTKLHTDLLNREVDDKNKQFHKRLESLQDKYSVSSM